MNFWSELVRVGPERRARELRYGRGREHDADSLVKLLELTFDLMKLTLAVRSVHSPLHRPLPSQGPSCIQWSKAQTYVCETALLESILSPTVFFCSLSAIGRCKVVMMKP